MAEIADLYTVLRAETAPFTRGMRQAAEEGEAVTKRMGGLRQMMVKLGAATTLVGVGFAVYGVKAAGDFQQKMNLLVTACGESSAKLKQVSDGVLSLARQTGTSTGELADGMYQVEKAGYRAGDGLTVLKAAAQGAREEGASLKDVTNAMTSVMASYHLKASDSVRVMNALKTAAGEGKMTMEEFSRALSTVIPIASANKVSFGEVGGAIATLTQHGTSAQEATQELSNTIRNLAAPNNVAVQEMQRLGLSSVDVSTKLGQRGLTGTLNLLSQTVLSKMGPSGTVLLSSFNRTKQAAADADLMVKNMPPSLQKLALSYAKGSISLGNWRKTLKTLPPEQANLLSQYATLQNKTNGFNDALKRGGPAAQTYTEAIKKMTGGATGLNTTLQLTGESAAGFKDRVTKVSASFNHASKDVEGWKVTQASFNVQMGRLKEAVTTTAITIGLKLIPVILKVVSYFEKHRTAVLALATAIGVVLAAAVTSFAVGAVVSMAKNLGLMVKGIRAASLAIKEFAITEKIAAIASKVWAAAQWLLNAALDANPLVLIALAVAALVAGLIYAYFHCQRFREIVQAAFRGVEVAALAVWHSLQVAWAGIVVGVQWLWQHMVSAWNAIVTATTSTWSAITGAVMTAWNATASWMVGAWHTVVDPIVHAWQWIENATTTAWNRIIGFFKKWWPLILVIAFPFIAGLIALWNHFHQQVFSVVRTVWGGVMAFLSAAWAGIKVVAALAWRGIQIVIINPVVATWHQLQALWTTVAGWLLATWRGIQAGAAAVWNGIKATAAAVWAGIRLAVVNPMVSAWHSLQSIARSIAGLLSAAWSSIRGTASALWGQIRSAMTGPITSAKNTIATTISSIKTAISNGLSSALSAVKGIGSQFVAVGEAIINGIKQGVENQAKSLANSVKGAANGALDGAKSFLGIGSPSRVFAEQVGQWIPAGIAQGITGNSAVVHQALNDTAAGAVTSFSAALEISSPSKKFKTLGAYVISGLVSGLTGSTARVRAATEHIARSLYTNFGSSHKALQKAIGRDNSQLMRLARQRDSVATRLKAAQKNLAALGKAWASEKASVASGIMQNASIITESPVEGRGVNSSDVIAQMRTRVQQAQQFASELDQLRKKGLRSDLIQQLASAGADQAGGTALALAGGSSAQIKQMNQLQAGLSSAANATGAAVANSMYGAGIQSAQGLVRGLQSQERAIEAQMMRIAKSMQGAIKKALGIRSPSRVMAELGDYTAQGMAVGIERSTKHAAVAAQGLAMAVQQGAALTGGAYGTGAGGTVVHNHVHITVQGSVTSERNLVETVRVGLLKGGLRNSTVGLTPKR